MNVPLTLKPRSAGLFAFGMEPAGPVATIRPGNVDVLHGASIEPALLALKLLLGRRRSSFRHGHSPSISAINVSIDATTTTCRVPNFTERNFPNFRSS